MADNGGLTLLNDEQMRNFVVNGVLTIKSELPATHHETVCRKLDDMFGGMGNMGNNVLPLIPEIQQVFDDPTVAGAMTSVLGENYLMHPHRYCHANQPGSTGQDAHKDTYEGDEQVKRHRCRWTLAFYYPQDTTVEMGPSAVLPGTQYYETAEAAHAHPETALCCEAGTVAIVHYDLWHRGTSNTSSQKRYMLKFLFTRLEEPTHPAWCSDNAEWQPPEEVGFSVRQDALWRRLWEWNCGSSDGAPDGNCSSGRSESSRWVAGLGTADETVGLNAAYSLATGGDATVSALLDSLRNGSELARRHATHALGAIGSSAVPALIDGLGDVDPHVRVGAAYALGDAGGGADEALPALTNALADNHAWVRRHAVEALGIMGRTAGKSAPQIGPLLRDEHEWVRDNAARALAKIGPDAEAAVPMLEISLHDDSRYVRFHAAAALKRIDTARAREALFRNLLTSRWCPLTTNESPY